MTARCGEARRLVWPDENLRVADRELIEARAHVAQCPACQSFVADMESMSSVVRRLAPRPVIPPALRARLLSTVARERSTAPRWQLRIPHRTRTIIAGAIAIAALALIVLLPTQQDRGDETWRSAVSAMVGDHARELHHDSLTTSDARMARQWLNARVAFAVEVPEVTGIVLERAEICRLNGLRACLLRYRVDGQPVSYYSYELSPDEIPDETTASPEFRQGVEAGYRVVSWQEAGVVRALVADLPADRLVALARACRSSRNRG